MQPFGQICPRGALQFSAASLVSWLGWLAGLGWTGLAARSSLVFWCPGVLWSGGWMGDDGACAEARIRFIIITGRIDSD